MIQLSLLRSIDIPFKADIDCKAHHDLQYRGTGCRKTDLKQRTLSYLLHKKCYRYPHEEGSADALYHHEPCLLDAVAETDEAEQEAGEQTVYGFIKNFADKHDFVPTTIHQLRHTNATILIHSGTDVNTLQEWLGHSSAQVTLDIYSHELQTAKMLASKAISDALDKSIAV